MNENVIETVEKESVRSLGSRFEDENSNSYELSDRAVERLNEGAGDDDTVIETESIPEEIDIDIMEYYESFYFKYLFEGCSSIDEIIDQLDLIKNTFQRFKDQGHELLSPVQSGYCFVDKITQRRR
jgi:hypothetical protein